MPPSPDAVLYERHFSDLDTAVQAVQERFQGILENPCLNGSADAFCRLQLAVHEWMGNLTRHAQFSAPPPEIRVCLWVQEGQVCCTIEDNSEGFNLQGQLASQHSVEEVAQMMPEGGMGLLLVEASTSSAQYAPLSEDANRLNLVVDVDVPDGDAPSDDVSSDDLPDEGLSPQALPSPE